MPAHVVPGEPVGDGENTFWYYVIGAIAVRVAIKWTVPQLASVEPIIPVAVLLGAKYGTGKGATAGVLGYAASNFLLGSFGDWTIWQAAGGAIAGWLGGAYVRADPGKYVAAVVGGTVAYEIVLNVYGGGLSVSYFFGSGIFGVIHVVSNLFFALLLSGALDQKKDQAPESEKKEG